LVVEIYEDKVYLAEYKRRHNMTEDQHQSWLNDGIGVVAAVTQVSPEQVYSRVRQRKSGRTGQYQKLDEQKNEFIVSEQGLRFIVNLSDYLDTGLFLDHRLTRKMVQELSKDKKVLNLFCYTGSFSVYAAAGDASKVVSVDLSKTYLAWTERNMQLNFPEDHRHSIVHADVKQFLTEGKEKFDIIVMDPPTFSNSKRMDDILDIQRDHVTLINQCLEILNPGGTLFFSTNFTKFKMETAAIRASAITDITRATTPFDFSKLQRPCFRISK
jgi:23S rRNA (cytosine1962-C5)-methyltransferase